MFEQAREAMNAGIEKSQESSPGTQTQDTTQAPERSENVSASGSKQPSLTELDKLERFLYDGKEWTPKELKSSIMRQQDYTQKTQEVAQERKYYENLKYDLDKVRDNPALADEFRKIYPEKYHAYLSYIEQRSNSQAAPNDEMNQNQQQQQQMQLPRDVQERLKAVDELQAYVRAQESRTVETKLEVLSERLGKKYDAADEVSVLAKAQALHNQGVKLDDEKWEEIWKSEHDRSEALFARRQKAMNDKQQSASRAGVDVGSGGGIPGQGPKGPTNFKEATAAMLRDFAPKR